MDKTKNREHQVAPPIVNGMQAALDEAWVLLRAQAAEWKSLWKTVDWTSMAEGHQRFVTHLPDQVRMLATHGWFISSFHTPLASIYPTASFFRAGKADEANQALCEHFRSVLGEIEGKLSEDFPARVTILKKAFAAHRAGDFELSIPVFLAQADGIAREVVAKETPRFSISSKLSSKAITEFISSVSSEDMTRCILEVVLAPIPLTESEGSQLLTGNVLNRHSVLHGTDTNYATPLNSYRAISWLEFVSNFDSLLRIKGKEKSA